jgi:hypothetical protein
MAVLKCSQCGNVLITEAWGAIAPACPHCQTALPQPTPAIANLSAGTAPSDGISSEPCQLPPEAPPQVVAVEVVEDTTLAQAQEKADVLGSSGPRRRKKRRKKKSQAPTSPLLTMLASAGVYLAGLGIVVLIWLVIVILSLVGSYHGAGLIVYGVVVCLVGVVWLYIGTLLEGDMPASPFEMYGRGGIAVAIGGVLALVRLGLFIFYGLMFAVTNPAAAWKPVVLTFVGLLIVGSGILFLRLGS